MKLEKAIEILEDLLGESPQFSPDDRRDAVKLGIEALKVVQWNRTHKYSSNALLLCHETEK